MECHGRDRNTQDEKEMPDNQLSIPKPGTCREAEYRRPHDAENNHRLQSLRRRQRPQGVTIQVHNIVIGLTHVRFPQSVLTIRCRMVVWIRSFMTFPEILLVLSVGTVSLTRPNPP